VKAASVQPAHWLVGGLSIGIAAANVARIAHALALVAGVGLALAAALLRGQLRLPTLVLGIAIAGWWWGSARLSALDRSPLLSQVGRAERSRVVVTGPPRLGRFDVRLPGRLTRFGPLGIHEQVLLELPLGRSPPQGAILDVLGVVALPRGPSHGFDERAWLRRHGMHVVLRVDDWRQVGRRGGVGGLADRLRARLAGSATVGLRGERRALVEGVVLGDDQGLSDELRQRFRASGLYHLLAVSGQNVVLVAGGALLFAWLTGIPRWLGELGALGAIAAYVLAVGAQPSVVRAGIAGALGSLAWLAARERDRWHFLLLGALALLAWNPYNLLDAGFQLSFVAVVAIFVVAPRLDAALEGYPVPAGLRGAVAISAACGALTAPILWFQFHAIPLLTVPANALAAPVAAPLLGLALLAAALAPFSPAAAGGAAWLNGWCAAYLAGCARIIGGLPFAQIRSGRVAAVLGACAVAGAAYAWRRWPRPP